MDRDARRPPSPRTPGVARLAAAGALLWLAAAPSASAQVVSGGILRELGLTPSVGRGYSPGANGLYSICFESVPTLEPSFSFDYRFADVDQDGAVRGAAADAVVDATTAEMLRAATGEGKAHHLLGVLTIDSYYATLDESQAELSPPVLALLRSSNLLGFFTTCGSHYVRSVSRRAYFLTLFSYAATDAHRDSGFERDLENAVRRFSVTSVDTTGDDGGAFAARARQHRLRIATRAVGFRLDRTESVVPFNLQDYLAALRGALETAEREPTGRVTSMEVTPWLTNPAVLAAIDLRAPDGVASPAAHRMRVADNAELILGLDARLDHYQDVVDLARACRATIEERELARGGTRAELVGHRTGRRMPLATVSDAVSEDAMSRLEAAARAYAGTDHQGGALACITALEASGLERDARTVPECAAASDDVLAAADLIEDFCPPDPVPVAVATTAMETETETHAFPSEPASFEGRPNRVRILQAVASPSPAPPAPELEIDLPLIAAARTYLTSARLEIRGDGVAAVYHARLGLPRGAELGVEYQDPISTTSLPRMLAITAGLFVHRDMHLELAPHIAAQLAVDDAGASRLAVGLAAQLTYARRVQLRLGGDQLVFDARAAALAVPLSLGIQLSGSTYLRAEAALPIVAVGPDAPTLASSRLGAGAIVRLAPRVDLLLHAQADLPPSGPTAASAIIGFRYRGAW